MKFLTLVGFHVVTSLPFLAQAISETESGSYNQQRLDLPQEILDCAPISEDDFHYSHDESPRPRRIAIIGAGPAGSSTAYHLSKFSNEPLNITIFDSNPYIGGRSITVNAFDDPRYPFELGASIFVDINAILYNATRDFDLPVDDRSFEGTSKEVVSKYELGVWDGVDFVFYAGPTSEDENEGGGNWMGKLAGWWDIAKLFWRYGLSPLRLRKLQQSVIGRFLRMYGEEGGGVFPFADLTNVATEVDLLSVTAKSGSILLKEAGISEKFATEIIQASSRVNYAQNLHDFHGLETMVCMSTEGAMSIDGGNWQIFDRMVKYSRADVRLSRTVTNVETDEDGISHVTSEHSNQDDRGDEDHDYSAITYQGDTQPFDTVVIAHPNKPSPLRLHPNPNLPFEEVDYVNLHVTLFASPSRPHPNFFNFDSSGTEVDYSVVPSTILTTLPPSLDPSLLGRGPAALGLTPFWSLSTLRALNPSTDSFSLIPGYLKSGNIPSESLALNTTQYLYKIFSPEPLTASFLIDLFQWPLNATKGTSTTANDRDSGISSLPKDLLTWHHEKIWQSYPYLPPRTTFENFDVYANDENLKGKVWRTSPMEVFISTMETMALSGRNVARLIVDGLEEKKRKHGCRL